MKCSNAKRQCTWEGTIGTLEDHLSTCQFTLVPCPKTCKDSSNQVVLVIRKYLDHHLKKCCPHRDYICQYCGEEGSYADITEVHDLVCEEKIVNCPHKGCSRSMLRFQVEEHVQKECVWTVVSCKYESIGCGVKLRRHDMPAHEQEDKQLHLDMSMNTTVLLKHRIAELEDTVASLIQASQERMDSLETAVTALKTEKSSATKEMGKITDPPQLVSTFSVANYKKKVAANKDFMSSSFFTGERGYHLAVELDVNAVCSDTGRHVLSLYVHVKRGRYDRTLQWPLIGEVTVTLLNQIRDKDHYSAIVPFTSSCDMRPGKNMGYYSFIPQDKLILDQDTKYLVNDTLKFKVYYKSM